MEIDPEQDPDLSVCCKFTGRESGAGAEIRDLVVGGFPIHWIRDDAKRVMASSVSAMISNWNSILGPSVIQGV